MYLHSPFVFDFYQNTILKVHTERVPNHIESFYTWMPAQIKTVERSRWGASQTSGEISLKALVDIVSVSKKFGNLLYLIIEHYKPNCLIETGTCVGLGTSYLASAAKTGMVYTIDAHPAYLKIAQQFTQNEKLTNIQFVESEVIDGLKNLLQKGIEPDFVYIDANHTYRSVIEQFDVVFEKAKDDCIWVIDDIRWSEEMYKAWEVLQSKPRVSISVDLGRMGLLFFNKSILEKQHFMIRF